VFHYHDARLWVHFHPGHTRSIHAQWPQLLGPVTPLMEEAMQAFIDIASDPQFEFQTYLQPGDAAFMNNYALLHRRSAFQDGEELDQRRHLVRLWLAVEGMEGAPHLAFPRSYITNYDRESYEGLLRPDPNTFHVQRSDGKGNH
jgi:hypothetical protein